MRKKIIYLLLISFSLLYFYCGKETPKEKEVTETPSVALPPEREIAVIETEHGKIYIDFLEMDAPEHVKNFKKLITEKAYDETTFHRVIPGYLIQGGDPLSKDSDRGNDGIGGPGYTLPREIKAKHVKGAVAAGRMPDNVNPEKRSNGSQFYICLKDLPELDEEYTVFGQVVAGLEIIEKISLLKRDTRDNPLKKVKMKIYLINT